jgi:hypothetical protein
MKSCHNYGTVLECRVCEPEAMECQIIKGDIMHYDIKVYNEQDNIWHHQGMKANKRQAEKRLRELQEFGLQVELVHPKELH